LVYRQVSLLQFIPSSSSVLKTEREGGKREKERERERERKRLRERGKWRERERWREREMEGEGQGDGGRETEGGREEKRKTTAIRNPARNISPVESIFGCVQILLLVPISVSIFYC
jgi:hypothetical protein